MISHNVNIPAEEVEERVTARLARRSLFSEERPAWFTFYLHEAVLRLPIGGPAVMREQLQHLLRMSARSCVTLRVVPDALGAYAGLSGPFILMEFAEFRPVTYLDSETSSLFLERRDEAAAYQRILAALTHAALDEEQSRELIATLATERTRRALPWPSPPWPGERSSAAPTEQCPLTEHSLNPVRRPGGAARVPGSPGRRCRWAAKRA